MKEEQLQYIWVNRLFSSIQLDGKEIDVLDVGQQNSHEGPDFELARLRIDGIVWVGSVEIHEKSSMWQQHGHHEDSNYNGVVLHVVLEDNGSAMAEDGRVIPTAIMRIEDEVFKEIEQLEVSGKALRCVPELLEIDKVNFEEHLSELLEARIARKLNELSLRSDERNINAIFYQTLLRYMGAHQNNEAMECVARSLPIQVLKKHANEVVALEAMLIGQANLFDENPRDEYEEHLQQEYLFYQQKFGLTPIAKGMFRAFRVQPASYPARRLAIAAEIIKREGELLEAFVEKNQGKIFEVLSVIPNSYWQTHFDFDRTFEHKHKGLGKGSQEILFINVIVPTAYYYSKLVGDSSMADWVIGVLRTIPAEKNKYISIFEEFGVCPLHAADSQALLELYHNYCEPYRCLSCPMALEIFSKLRENNNEKFGAFEK